MNDHVNDLILVMWSLIYTYYTAGFVSYLMLQYSSFMTVSCTLWSLDQTIYWILLWTIHTIEVRWHTINQVIAPLTPCIVLKLCRGLDLATIGHADIYCKYIWWFFHFAIKSIYSNEHILLTEGKKKALKNSGNCTRECFWNWSNDIEILKIYLVL